MAKDENGNQFVSIGASLGGIFLVITLFFLIFANDRVEFLVSIAWAFVVLGIFLGLFSLLAGKGKKK